LHRIFIFVLFIGSISFADDLEIFKIISLKKDEEAKILVKYAQYQKVFQFRWTLYKNRGLVIHRSYNRSTAQNVLYLNYTNQAIHQDLKPRGADYYNVPYILVTFSKFDYKKHEAEFKIYLSDERSQIELQFLKNK